MDEFNVMMASFLGVMAFMAAIGGLSLHFVRTMDKRSEDYYEEKAQLLAGLIDTMSVEEKETYKKLPHDAARRGWIGKNRDDFIGRMPYMEIALSLDLKLLRIDEMWGEEETLQRYLGYSASMSLTSYQTDLDAFTAWVKKTGERSIDKEKASMELWESLDEQERRLFKRAGKVSERKKLLAEANPDSSGYEVDYLYPTMLSTCLGVDSSDTSYFDGSFFGGGYSDSGGGGDGGGGDGGGGGGGGD